MIILSRFHLKFQQIVQAEQAMNFITRLHRNRLDIVPWPVIESKQFYTLFKAIKRRLDQQAFTHSGGAVFLQTMKTLMAKLKVCHCGFVGSMLQILTSILITKGERLGLYVTYVEYTCFFDAWSERFLENLAAHRAQLLLSLLPNALAFGASEIIPDFEPLTVYFTHNTACSPD